MAMRRLPPAPCAEAVAAMRAHGTITAAAKALGLHESTFRHRLTEGLARERGVPPEKRDADQLRAKVAQLEACLGEARRAKVPAFKAAPARTRRRDDLVRVIIPDSHGCYADPTAIAAFLADLKALCPDHIVMLGDHVDCGGFLAAHHTMGYVAQMDYTYESDIAATASFLSAIQAAAPRATIDYLEGNHEQRVERWCVTQALATKQDADFLRKAFAPEYLLRLASRGIRYHRRAACHDGLPVPGTIQRGRVFFTHEMGASKNAASVIVRKFGASVVFGHTHRAQSDIIRTVTAGSIGAWSPGCLCVQQPLYAHTTITDWSQGYAVELVARSGDFLHINIPVIDGRSYLAPLMRRMLPA